MPPWAVGRDSLDRWAQALWDPSRGMPMDEAAYREHRAVIAYRSAQLGQWKHEESYGVFMQILQELYDKALALLLQGPKDNFEAHRGYLKAIDDVRAIADRAMYEQRLQAERAN